MERYGEMGFFSSENSPKETSMGRTSLETAPSIAPSPAACYPAAIVNHKVTREQHREKTRDNLRRCWKLREGKKWEFSYFNRCWIFVVHICMLAIGYTEKQEVLLIHARWDGPLRLNSFSFFYFYGLYTCFIPFLFIYLKQDMPHFGACFHLSCQ